MGREECERAVDVPSSRRIRTRNLHLIPLHPSDAVKKYTEIFVFSLIVFFPALSTTAYFRRIMLFTSDYFTV